MNGENAPEGSRRQWMPWLRLSFVGATLAAAAIFLLGQRSGLVAAADQAEPCLLAAGLAIATGNALFACGSWYALMWPHRVRMKLGQAMRLFFTSQLGKYLPGGIWPFVAAAELGRDAGFGRRAMVASFTLALFIGIGTGAIMATYAIHYAINLPGVTSRWIWLAGLPLAAIFLPPVRRFIAHIAKLEETPEVFEILASSLFALIAWVFAGIHLLLLSAAVGSSMDWSMLVSFTGIYAASWLVGFLFMIAPAGFGPREATMIALLASIMPLADATLVALLSRVGMTLADFMAAGLAAIVPRLRAGR